MPVSRKAHNFLLFVTQVAANSWRIIAKKGAFIIRFAFVDIIINTSRDTFPNLNRSALIKINGCGEASHVAYYNRFYPLGYRNPITPEKFTGTLFAQIIKQYDNQFFTPEINFWEDVKTHRHVPVYKPVQIKYQPNFNHRIGIADITMEATYLWERNPNFASQDKVRNRQALVVYNESEEITHVLQAAEFREVDSKNIKLHKSYDTTEQCGFQYNKSFEFDNTWENLGTNYKGGTHLPPFFMRYREIVT